MLFQSSVLFLGLFFLPASVQGGRPNQYGTSAIVHQQQHSYLRSSNSTINTTITVPTSSRLLDTSKDHPAGAVQQYALWKASQIRERVHRWAEHYGDFVKLSTAQDAYGLPTAGGEYDCPFDEERTGCLNYILKIQDYEANPIGSEASKRLPEVLWSGEVHGNEQVGPTAVLEATSLLLQAASCEAHPRASLKPATEREQATSQVWRQELEHAQDCRKELRDFGIDDEHRRWLARLVATRRIVVVPTANALGYFRSRREENNIDPNRDFPYEQEPSRCMQTIAGRTLNEVFREHMFQLSLTFHGGMEVVGYEWGAPKWEGHYSPDHVAQQGIGSAYSRYGGGWSSSHPYNSGPMNDLVYGVHGGMEDWAYAGSWDPERVIPCEPTTFGGYPKEKTIYDESTLRVFNMLVETSNTKIPSTHLGTSLDVMRGDTTGNGHISRNIRLALLAAELVEPYVSISTVNGMAFRDDIVPLMPHGTHTDGCSNEQVMLSKDTSTVTVEWKVGGALTIDNTEIWYGKWSDAGTSIDCWFQPSANDIKSFMKKGTPRSGTSGKGAFAESKEGISASPVFSADIDLTGFAQDDLIVVMAVAIVDQDWTQQPHNVQPQVPPQAHIVNARTNPSWNHEKEGSIIEGRLEWFSRPLTISLGDSSRIIKERFSAQAEPSLPEQTVPAKSGARFMIFVGVLLVGSAVLIGSRHLQGQMRSAKRSQVREFIEDESSSAELPGLQGKANGTVGTYTDTPGVEDVDGQFELT